MSQGRFQSKSAKIILTTFIVVIIFSFLFTTIGTGSGSVSASNIAEVGDYGITPKEFNNAYNATMQQYNQIFKGQAVPPSLTGSIQKSTLTRLESQKIILNLADKLGLVASDKEIKENIKNQEYFQTNKQFDFNKYKSLLKANNYSPKSYEDIVRNDVRTQKFYSMLGNIRSSKAAESEIDRIKNSTLPISVAKVESYSLRDYIEVSPTEIKEFVAKPENKPALTSVYNEKRAEYQVPASYTYRTIFFNKLGKDNAEVKKKADEVRKNLTAKNFAATASKESSDPVTKTKGGLVGTKPLNQIQGADKVELLKLKPGQISPVYQTSLGYSIVYLEKVKPKVDIKLEDVQSKLAVTAIQREKTDELDKLYKDVVSKVTDAMKKSDFTSIQSLSKKYGFTFNKEASLSRFSNEAAGIEFKPDNTAKLYTSTIDEVQNFDRVTFTVIASRTGEVKTPDAKVDDENVLGNDLQAELSSKMIQAYKEKNPVSYNPNFQLQ